MEVIATLVRSLEADVQADVRDVERAVAAGSRDASRSLKTELRRLLTFLARSAPPGTTPLGRR